MIQNFNTKAGVHGARFSLDSRGHSMDEIANMTGGNCNLTSHLSTAPPFVHGCPGENPRPWTAPSVCEFYTYDILSTVSTQNPIESIANIKKQGLRDRVGFPLDTVDRWCAALHTTPTSQKKKRRVLLTPYGGPSSRGPASHRTHMD